MSCHPFGRTRIFHGMGNWTDSTQPLPPCFCCHPYIPLPTIRTLVEVQTGRGRLHDQRCFFFGFFFFFSSLTESMGIQTWCSSEVIHMLRNVTHRKSSYTEFFPPVTFRPRPIQRLDRGLRGTSDWTPDNPAFTLY